MAEKETKEAKEPSRKELQRRMKELNEEYRFIAAEANSGSTAAQARRTEIAKELRAISETLFLREPDVDVQVPRSVTGHPFRLGEHEFHPGRHRVKASQAQYLLWLIDKNRQDELNRLRSNGEEVNLGSVGERAQQVEREL